MMDAIFSRKEKMAKARCVAAVVLLVVLFIHAVSVIALVDELNQTAAALKGTVDSAKNAVVDAHNQVTQTAADIKGEVESTIDSVKKAHEEITQTASDVKSKVDSTVEFAKKAQEETMSWFDWFKMKLGF